MHIFNFQDVFLLRLIWSKITRQLNEKSYDETFSRFFSNHISSSVLVVRTAIFYADIIQFFHIWTFLLHRTFISIFNNRISSVNFHVDSCLTSL